MSMLFHSADKPTKINQVQINQSVQGFPLPVVLGRAKVQQSLLWLDGLSSKQVSQGGKGLGGGKGGSYLYSADVIAALCAGPISGVGDVWSGQSWLSNSKSTETYTVTGGTPSYTPANASSGVFLDGGVGMPVAYSQTQTDLGSGGSNTLSGTDLVPMTAVPFGTTLTTGQYSIDPSTNTYHFSTADASITVVISYTFALNIIKQQETALIPSGKTVQVGGTFEFNEDDGVVYFTGPNDGVALTKVSGTPTVTGTYSVSGSGPATYHFATGDINAEVQITYKIKNNAAVPTGAPGSLNFQVFEGEKGQALWSLLVSTFPQAALGYTGIAYVAYDPMTLGYAADVQQNVYEVHTPDAYGGGIVDCNPVTCLLQVLTNVMWGLGAGAVPFPLSAIDNAAGGTWGNSSTTTTTRVTTTGGSALVKLSWSSSLPSFPIPYITAVMVRNNSATKTVKVSDNLGGSTDVVPGATVAVVLNDRGDGTTDNKLIFSALSTGDALDFTIWNPSIASAPGANNLMQGSTQPGSTGWTVGSGVTITYATDRPNDKTAWSWFAANSFFISPVIDNQDSAASLMSKWLEAGQCAAFMSEGLLKLVPYGDTSTAGNGVTWQAPTAFATSLDDTCFVRKQEGEDPVKISSSPWQDAYNTVQVQWSNRTNQYAPEVTPESDQAAINRYGARIEDPQSWDFIRTLAAATFAASMRVKRNVYTRNTYEFTLPFSYSYLENMDVVEITTSSIWAAGLNNANLGVVNLPVRITKIVDNPDGNLNITAEDYPFGVHQPTIYNKGLGVGQGQPNLFTDPGDTTAVVFEATSRLTGFQGNQIWIGANGASNDWGSCNVFVSADGTTYKQVGAIDVRARLGVLDSTFASGADPDTSDALVVDMAPNTGQLEAGSSADADAGNTLCYVDGEIIAYSAAAVTGPGQYTLDTYIRRGQMGSPIASHASASTFLRLDDAVFRYTYDPSWGGKTVFFKFQSVNSFNNAAQDISTLTPVTFAIPGQSVDTPPAVTTAVINGDFEVSAELPPYAWPVDPTNPAGSAQYSYNTSGPFQGTRSLRLTALSGFKSSLRNQQKYLVKPGDTYKLSAEMQMPVTGSGTTGNVILIFYGLDDTDVKGTLTLNVTASDSSWTSRTGTGVVPSGSTYAYITVTTDATAGGGGGLCDYDSITLLRAADLTADVVGSLPITSVGARTGAIQYVIDGGGSVVSTGVKGQVSIPTGCTVTGWVITADQSGSAVVDVLRATYSGFPSTSSIAGTDPPTLSSAQKNEDLALSGWGSTAIAAGDILQFSVSSCTTCTRLIVTLNVEITG